MAGHSKFANIRHRKAAQDAKRGKLFTKLISEITVASRLGGADITSNPRLRDAIEKALKANMTRDTVDRAIKRGSGDYGDKTLEEILYEGYGPGGSAMMVRCLTDNRNRTVADVRHAFTKSGGSLATTGAVSYLFHPCGIIHFSKETDQDSLLEAGLALGIEDMKTDQDTIQMMTPFESFFTIKDSLAAKGFEVLDSECTQIPNSTVTLSSNSLEIYQRLWNRLEDLDDVQQIYSNAIFAEDNENKD